LYIDGTKHNVRNQAKYSGSGVVTIGTWQTNSMTNNLVVDHLIISSGLIHYENPESQQLCFAKLADKRLP
jgi:hypothetical protein